MTDQKLREMSDREIRNELAGLSPFALDPSSQARYYLFREELQVRREKRHQKWYLIITGVIAFAAVVQAATLVVQVMAQGG